MTVTVANPLREVIFNCLKPFENERKKLSKKEMTTKVKANTILEKKLEELECLLEELRSGDPTANREFRLRFIFTHTLLTAEISSVNEDEEEEMLKFRCMAKRLTELDEEFKRLTGSIHEPDMQTLQSDGDVVNVDDQSGLVRNLVDESGLVRSLVESLQEEYVDSSLEEKLAKRRTEKIKTKRFRGLVSFCIVGLVAGLVSLFGYLYDQMNEKTIFLTPT